MQSNPSQRPLFEVSEPIFEIGAAPADGFIRGELYLFHRSEPECPADSALWGVFDRIEEGSIRLETSSRDLFKFHFRRCLPAAYRYARRATRPELRDYTADLAYYECCWHEQIIPHRCR